MTAVWLLTVHDIGRAGQSDATETTVHKTHQEATTALYGKYDPRYIRGGTDSGTIGMVNGKVFQASKTWTIQEARLVK